MSYLRKSLWWVATLVVAASVFSGSAQAQKTFTVTPPATLSIGKQTVQFIYTITGNSNPNSLELDSTSANAAFDTTVTPTLSAGFSGQVSILNSTTIQFINISPSIKKSITVTVGVIGSDSSCSSATATWFAHAWTGSPSNPAQTFTLTNSPSSIVNPACSLAFATQPANAFVGSVITTVPFNSMATPPVTVQALQGTTPVSGLSVSIGSTGACSVSGSATTDSSGNAKFTSIASSTAGTGCTLTATASGFPGATSNAFDVVTDLGPLDCVPAENSSFGDLGSLLAMQFADPPVIAIPPVGAPTWGLLRGTNRTGPNDCPAKVPFTFTLNDDNTATFTEDSGGQQTSVEYIVRWAPTDLVNGWSDFQPCISYGIANPQLTYDNNGVCFGDYVPAPACLADDVNGPGDGTAVMPVFPATYPYTAAASPHYAGTTAKVCISQQGWNSDNGQVQFWHKFIDQSDTRIVGP